MENDAVPLPPEDGAAMLLIADAPKDDAAILLHADETLASVWANLRREDVLNVEMKEIFFRINPILSRKRPRFDSSCMSDTDSDTEGRLECEGDEDGLAKAITKRHHAESQPNFVLQTLYRRTGAADALSRKNARIRYESKHRNEELADLSFHIEDGAFDFEGVSESRRFVSGGPNALALQNVPPSIIPALSLTANEAHGADTIAMTDLVLAHFPVPITSSSAAAAAAAAVAAVVASRPSIAIIAILPLSVKQLASARVASDIAVLEQCFQLNKEHLVAQQAAIADGSLESFKICPSSVAADTTQSLFGSIASIERIASRKRARDKASSYAILMRSRHAFSAWAIAINGQFPLSTLQNAYSSLFERPLPVISDVLLQQRLSQDEDIETSLLRICNALVSSLSNRSSDGDSSLSSLPPCLQVISSNHPRVLFAVARKVITEVIEGTGNLAILSQRKPSSAFVLSLLGEVRKRAGELAASLAKLGATKEAQDKELFISYPLTLEKALELLRRIKTKHTPIIKILNKFSVVGTITPSGFSVFLSQSRGEGLESKVFSVMSSLFNLVEGNDDDMVAVLNGTEKLSPDPIKVVFEAKLRAADLLHLAFQLYVRLNMRLIVSYQDEEKKMVSLACQPTALGRTNVVVVVPPITAIVLFVTTNTNIVRAIEESPLQAGCGITLLPHGDGTYNEFGLLSLVNHSADEGGDANKSSFNEPTLRVPFMVETDYISGATGETYGIYQIAAGDSRVISLCRGRGITTATSGSGCSSADAVNVERVKGSHAKRHDAIVRVHERTLYDESMSVPALAPATAAATNAFAFGSAAPVPAPAPSSPAIISSSAAVATAAATAAVSFRQSALMIDGDDSLALTSHPVIRASVTAAAASSSLLHEETLPDSTDSSLTTISESGKIIGQKVLLPLNPQHLVNRSGIVSSSSAMARQPSTRVAHHCSSLNCHAFTTLWWSRETEQSVWESGWNVNRDNFCEGCKVSFPSFSKSTRTESSAGISFDFNDDFCYHCKANVDAGGNDILLCCDSCKNAFHFSCLREKGGRTPPSDNEDFFCKVAPCKGKKRVTMVIDDDDIFGQNEET